MRIGFLLPGGFALSGPGNGIAEQARQQAAALERRGHTVVCLDPWHSQNGRQLDVLQFFLGGPQLHDVTANRELIRDGLLVFAPIIDSNESFAAYRAVALAGSVSPRMLTVPGVLRRQALRSDVVLCRSTYERERLIRGLGVAADRVALVLNGCPPPMQRLTHGLTQGSAQGPMQDSAQDADRAKEVLRTLGLPAEEFVLHISAYTQERKNILRLLEATEVLGYPLVVAGTAVSGNVLTNLNQRARAGAKLRTLGFVDDATKAALCSSCRVFALPSTHEGTGLAALEAAAHGARIVITRNGGPRDYFGEHAEYVNPFDVADIRRALERAWHRPADATLRDHVTRNLTWDRSAASLERVYLEHLQRVRGAHPARHDAISTDACELR